LSSFPDLNRCNNLEFLDISYNQIKDNLNNISVINTIQTCKLNNNLINWAQGEIIDNLNIIIKLVDLRVLNLHNNIFYDKFFSIIDSLLKLKCAGLRDLNDKPFILANIDVKPDFDFTHELKKMSGELYSHYDKDATQDQDQDALEDAEDEEEQVIGKKDDLNVQSYKLRA